jgi:hypothetical protein
MLLLRVSTSTSSSLGSYIQRHTSTKHFCQRRAWVELNEMLLLKITKDV